MKFNINWEEIGHTIVSGAMNTGIKLLVSIALIIISFSIIGAITRRIRNSGDKGKHDKTLTKVIAYLLNIGLKTVVVVALLGYLGIETSGFAALITSLGVGFGLAVQGALANLAGGILLLVTRPFKLDDFIESEGVSGTVENISIIYTYLRTPDNKRIMLPNGTLANSNIINYSANPIRRLDWTFSISYDADFFAAKKALLDLLNAHEKILQTEGKEPIVRMSKHASSAIEVLARVWVNSGDYWNVFYDINEQVKLKFDELGISIPYEQLDVHLDTVEKREK